MKTTALPLAFLLLFTECSKNSSGEKDTVRPVVNIHTPSNGQVLTNGQAVLVSGTVTDDKYVAEIHIHVYNNSTGALLLDVHEYPANATAGFTNQSLSASSGITYKIQVLAKDKGVNETTSTVFATCN